MTRLSIPTPLPSRPAPAAVLELLKPITWFAPMWAYGCGVVSSGQALGAHLPEIALGILLAGPLVCGTSQAANDWYDRHVDAINEPGRPIPSGRIPGRWGFGIAIAWTSVSLLVASLLGVAVLAAAAFGLALAWIYSAPPLRLKQNGWWGNAAVGLCYEGLPWFTGAAALLGGFPDGRIVALALLYSLGAHGIMTLNDFKSVEGDRQMKLHSLPVQLGVDRAAKLACWVMALPQIVVVLLLWRWGQPLYAGLVVALLLAQIALMVRLLGAPRERAAWYNATGTTLYVLGMLASACALRGLAQGAA
ncbi:MAG: chlorophyll synthase ChlG [Bosea sp. (in: a-proteobacteria)]